jgi:hypothetical protein
MAKRSQVQKFREAARKVEADDSEERFNSSLKALAKKSREPKRGKEEPPKPHK